MRVAIECAGFTAGEADRLRRSMATFKHTGGVSQFRDKLVAGMVANGYPQTFAEKTFAQLEGFGSYGFPESHAASFALLAYASSWMKCRHPDVFLAAILNAQPMGFYAPAQLVRDARRHGVIVRPVDVNASRWDCMLEPIGAGERHAVRLGLRLVRGLANKDAAAIVAARADKPFRQHRRAVAPGRRSDCRAGAAGRRRRVPSLARAGAPRRGLGDPGLARPAPAVIRGGGDARWNPDCGGVRTRRRAAADDGRARGGRGLQRDRADPAAASGLLPAPGACGQRHRCVRRGRCGARRKAADDIAVWFWCASGPARHAASLFITIEDETGIANIVVWPDLFEKQRRVILSAGMIAVAGRVQREGEVVHVIARTLTDLSPLLRSVGERDDRLAAAEPS